MGLRREKGSLHGSVSSLVDGVRGPGGGLEIDVPASIARFAAQLHRQLTTLRRIYLGRGQRILKGSARQYHIYVSQRLRWQGRYDRSIETKIILYASVDI